MELITKALDKYLEWEEATGNSDNTINNKYYEVHRFMDDMGIKKLSKITEVTLHNWINKAGGETTASTRKFKLSCLKMFLNYCLAKGWVKGNPAIMVRVDIRSVRHAQRETKKKLAFDKAEYRYLLSNLDWACDTGRNDGPCPNFWKAAIVIGVETGLRLGDIIQLEWDCFTPRSVNVWTDKKDKRVSLPMSMELREAIKSIKKTSKHYLFPVQRSEFLGGNRAKYSMQFNRLLKKLEFEGMSFHCTRVTFATWAKKAGGNLAKIAEDLGHSTTNTTSKHYIAG
jgi:integrase